MANDTTIVVQFGTSTLDDGAAAFAHLSAEIDRREGGRNGGVTTFEPGDKAYFLVYKSSNVTLAAPVASAGTAGFDGTENVEQSADVIFANTNEGSLSVPASSIVSTQWLGASLGAVTLGSDGQTLTAASSGVGVLRVTYIAPATVGYIQSPAEIAGLTDFSIVVLVVGNVT